MDTNRNSKEFNKALHDFAFDVAGGAAIRHLVNLGYSVSEIKQKLDFPLSEKQIGQAVWKHLVENGVICLEDPKDHIINEKVSYVTCKGEYGRTYFKRVVEKQEIDRNIQYLKCEFGKMRYKDRAGFEAKVARLNQEDQEYINNMPWPLQTVWHRQDDRIVRILDVMKD